MSSSRLVGIIPAAGWAVRLQPIEHSKETIPIRGRPVMDYVLERMKIAACHEIRVVTRPEKQDVIERARLHGADVVLGSPAVVGASIATGLEGLNDHDRVLVGFPDTVWEPSDGFVRLLRLVSIEGGAWPIALGLFRAGFPHLSEVVRLGAGDRVESVQVKPAKPTSNLVWGILAARTESLRGLEAVDELGHFLRPASRAGRVGGIHLSDSFFDVGWPRSS